MNKILLVAGAAALAFAGTAYGKPPHAQRGKGQAGIAQGHCPHGLAKKNAACMPPGQYKKLFEVGQRVPYGYGGLIGYDGLPYDLRSHYGSGLDPYDRYIYRDDYLYRVEPATMVVREVLRAIF